MAETMAPDFVTPPKGVHRFPVTSIVPTGSPLDEGIKLFLNKDLEGFVLEPESEGLWLSPVENTVTPRATGGGSLRNRRWADGDSFLVISLHSPSPEYMYDMFARLVEVVTHQDDYFDLVVFDPYSQEARRRTFLYESGLENLNEVTGTYHRVGVTAKFLSPFWRGPEREVVERIAPPVKPLITAYPGSPVNRWDDPEFTDSTAYEPWFVVDGGLEKQGTGAEHGRFVAGHRVEVNPGETVSVSAGLSFVDGPQVGDIQVRVRAYDADNVLVPSSASTVISESYGGTYTGTYVVPETGAEIELGFYTASDVHANTRARIDDLDVKREVQYLATYEWEGEPHASPSVKRVDGELVARNRFKNPSFEVDLSGITSSPTATLTRAGNLAVASGEWGLQVEISDSTEFGGWIYQSIDVAPDDWGHWVGWSAAVRNSINVSQLRWYYEVRQGRTVLSGDYAGTFDVTRDSLEDSPREVFAAQIDEGADNVRLWLRPVTSHAYARYFTDDWIAAVGGSEQAALDEITTYFDGDTPDELDQGSIEGAYSFPFFPVFLADSTVQGEHELRVEGDAPVWPIWEITGPGKDVEIIGPDGSRLFVEGEVTSPITIVTEPGKRSIRDASGLIWDRMKPGDDQFFALEPGEQTVKMTMVGGNPESTIRAVYSENWKTPRGTAQAMIGGGVDTE